MFNGILRFLLLLSVFLSACQPVSPATLGAPTTTPFASHGSPDTIIHSGDYSLEGRLFTFVNGWDCADTRGLYILRIISDGKSLLLDPQTDKCPDRPGTLKSFRWDKVEATPAP